MYLVMCTTVNKWFTQCVSTPHNAYYSCVPAPPKRFTYHSHSGGCIRSALRGKNTLGELLLCYGIVSYFEMCNNWSKDMDLP